MIENKMSVDEARAVLDLDSAPRPMRQAALTIVAQDETIQTLSRLLTGAEEAATERATQIERVRNALDSITRERADAKSARGHDDDAEWYLATADALEYVIDLLNEALGGTDE